MSKTPFIAAINSDGDIRAMMRLDDLPNIVDVIETLSEWAETDPSRRIVVAENHDQAFASRSAS